MKYQRLLPFLGKYKKYAILSPVTVIGEVMIEIQIPFLMAKIVDIGITNHDMPYILKMGGIMCILSLIGLLFGTLCAKYAALASAGLAMGIRQKVFDKVQDFSFANTDHFSIPSLVTRMTTDITFIQNAFMMIIRTLVRAPIMIISGTIMALKIDSELSWVYIISIPILGAIIAVISIKAHPLFQKMLKKYDAMNASVQENLVGIRNVKAFVRHEFEDEKFNASAEDVMWSQRQAERIVIWNNPAMMLAVSSCIMAIVWFGGNRIIFGKMQIGALFSFITYTRTILNQLMMISMGMITIVMSQASVDRILEVLDEKLDITDEGTDPDLKVKDGSIIFDDVSFSYSKNRENEVLRHIQLDIRSGETIGIIGGTGSAKSSLVQLIPRLYDTDLGCVRVGGEDVRKYRLKTLRDAVAIVLQKNVLFSGTIRENLLWGMSRLQMQKLKKPAGQRRPGIS